MQYHMRRLVEVTKDIDGFKEKYDNILSSIINKGEFCHGKRIKQERILQGRNH